MTIKELASKVAHREGNKSQARIGDIREILGILSDLVYARDINIETILYKNGQRRSAAKKKKLA